MLSTRRTAVISLRVSRTDAWGRMLVASVVLPDGAAGWPTYVTSWCANELTPGAPGTAGGHGPAGSAFGPRCRSSLTWSTRCWLTSCVTGAGGGRLSLGVLAALRRWRSVAGGSGASAVWLLDVDVLRRRPRSILIGVEEPRRRERGRSTAAKPGGFLALELVPRSRPGRARACILGADRAVYWLRVDGPRSTRRCGLPAQGRPDAAHGAHRRRGPQRRCRRELPERQRLGGHGGVRRAGGRHDGQPCRGRRPRAAGVLLRRLLPVTGDRHRDRRTRDAADDVVVYDCSGGGDAPPPTIELVVSTPGGDFPFRTQLSSGALTRAIIDGCTNTDEQQLVDSGDEPPVARRMTRSSSRSEHDHREVKGHRASATPGLLATPRRTTYSTPGTVTHRLPSEPPQPSAARRRSHALSTVTQAPTQRSAPVTGVSCRESDQRTRPDKTRPAIDHLVIPCPGRRSCHAGAPSACHPLA